MADYAPILDPAQQEEFARQAAARRAAIAIPSAAQPSPMLRAVTPSTPAPATPTLQPSGLQPVSGTADLENHIHPAPASVDRAAAVRGALPVQQEARANAGTPEEQNVIRASDRLNKAEDSVPATSKLMHASENIGSNPDSFMGRHPGIARIARPFAEVGSGVLRGVETAANIAAPGIMMNIPGTEFNRAAQITGAESQLGAAEKNRLEASQAGEQEAAADQKRNMQSQIIAAREKGFDLVQDPLTQKWTMSPLPANMTSAQTQADITQKEKPQIEVSPESGAVVQLSPDPKNPGQMVSSPVLDKAGKPTVLPPKPQGYDIKEELQPDGKVHNVAYDKADPSKKIVLGESKPSGSENNGKVYDNYSKQLETEAKPVEEKLKDATYLQTMLANKNKQSDSLIAPKLLTITTGGQGSGLRMNEAEISRVIGGRSVWDGLVARANQIQQSGGSFDDNQRAQISSIVQYMQTRSAAASYVMNSARQAMLAAQNDDKSVRSIHSHMEGILSQLDTKGLTPPGTPLRAGDFVMHQGQLLEVEIEKGKPMGVPVEVK